MDRVSGSGVFARDPDALLDLTELEITDALTVQQENELTCEIVEKWLKRFNLKDDISQDDLLSSNRMIEIAHGALPSQSYQLMMSDIDEHKKRLKERSAWRIEGTLREFPKFKPINVWFEYPIHKEDTSGVLADCDIEGDLFNSKKSPYKKNFSKKKSPEDKKRERKESLETAFSGVEINGEADIKELATYLGISEKTIRRNLKEHGGFWIDGSKTGYKDRDKLE